MKTEIIIIRVSDESKRRLIRGAKKAGMNLSAYVLAAAGAMTNKLIGPRVIRKGTLKKILK